MTGRISHLAGRPTFGPAATSVLTASDFATAAAEVTQWQGYVPTPLHYLADVAAEIGVAAVAYKDEGPRFGLGSFKALGGAYAAQRLLQRELSRRAGTDISLADIRYGAFADQASGITLVSATDGNHGRSLAWGCRRFGARCRIYIHANVSKARERAMRDLGADIERIRGDYDDSVIRCRQDAEINGWFVISDTSWSGYEETPRDVMAGYGVMLREVHEQAGRDFSHVFVQGGVGGLAAATAAALRQLYGAGSPRVVVVEPMRAACLFESARLGRPTAVTIETETIMAGLSCGEPSPLAWRVLESEVSDFLAVDDRLIPPTVRRLARPAGADPAIEAGESGVAGLAALIEAAGSNELRDRLDLGADSRVLLIGSEGVTDADIYAEIMRGA
ncbi:MAG: diaminopropionate ammonia-lyase [Woeseiaceae bacterium]|nr:diaminopropionate ammonia-lyase [Woeseiaceae bacterium]